MTTGTSHRPKPDPTIERDVSGLSGAPGRSLSFAPVVLALFSGAGIAWLVLVAGFILSIAGWYVSYLGESEDVEARFRSEAERVGATVLARMTNYEQVLIDGAAVFVSSEEVTRDEWANFLRSSDIFNRFPGVQATGFAEWVPDAARADHVARLRREGLADYDIRPQGQRNAYVPIVYNEPYEGRNRRVIGFDMYSEPIRRAAMDRAIATGKPAISGKVVLAGESADDRPPGFVIYAPAWRRVPGRSGDELLGFAFAPFRVGDLMSQMPKPWDKGIVFTIHDGNEINDQSLMYDSMPGQVREGTLVRRIALTVMGQPWTVEVRALNFFNRGMNHSMPVLTLVTGLVLTFLLFALTRALRHTQVSEERFRDYAELGSDWLWEVDRNFRFVYLSRPRLPPLGIDADKLLGRTWRESFSNLSYAGEDGFWQRLEQSMNNAEEFQHLEWRAELPTGGSCWLHISGRPILDKGNTLLGYRGGCADISRDRELTNQLIEAKQQVETVDRSKSQFLAMTSHEVRTPLNAIIGFAEVIEQRLFEAPDDPRYVEYAHGIAESGRRLLTIISELLEMSRTESSTSMNETQLDLMDLVRRAGSMLNDRALTQGVSVDIMPSDIPRVRAEERAMRQVLLNLLGNAIKFSPRGGKILITAMTDQGGGVRMDIADHGPGMTREALQAALSSPPQPQFSGGNGTNGGAVGGSPRFGLPICVSLLEMHGGSLEIESEPGRGTRAIIRLPAARVIR